MRYLSANSRAPWFIEHGSNVQRELQRIFSENLSKPATSMGIKVLDRVFVRESDDAVTLKVHHKGTPIADLAIFMAVFAYLYALYTAVRHYYGQTDNSSAGSKVKGT